MSVKAKMDADAEQLIYVAFLVLDAERERRGLTQRQCCEAVGLQRDYWSAVKNGLKPLGLQTLCRMAAAVDYHIELAARPSR